MTVPRWIKIGIAFVGSAFLAALLIAIGLQIRSGIAAGGLGFTALMFPVFLATTIGAAFAFGVPAFLVMRRLNMFNHWSASTIGLLIAFGLTIILFGNQFALIAITSGAGAIAALFFSFTWRRILLGLE